MSDGDVVERVRPRVIRDGFRKAFRGRVNTEHDQIYANIRRNIRRPIPQLDKHAPNDYTVALLCGGPSLAKAKIPKHYKIATVNATHDWALERGMKPSLFAMLDARSHNVRFVQNPVESCRYFLCNQVDPSVFDALDDYDVRIFHGACDPERKILDRYYAKRWHNVPGGGSIGTRAIGLLYFLGVRRIAVFGMDGCLVGGKHHAYPQEENDADMDAIRTVRVGRRRFQTHAWMISQADDFLRMVPALPKDLELGFFGDGLIAHIVNETARRGRAPRLVVEK